MSKASSALQEITNLPLIPRGYTYVRQIGSGGEATVHLVAKGNLKMVVKLVDKEARRDAEEAILSKLGSPHVVRSYGCIGPLGIKLEYCCGDLFSVISAGRRLQADQTQLMFDHMRAGLQALHAIGIVHMDVKPENMLVDVEDGRLVNLKVADFGLSCAVGIVLEDRPGSPNYCAPELITPAKVTTGFEMDMWSAGIVLHVMITQSFPWEQASRRSLEYISCMTTPEKDRFSSGEFEGFGDQLRTLLRPLQPTRAWGPICNV
jgi:serine/threonine protein kinase